MNDPMTSPWTSPEPTQRRTPGASDAPFPDTASIAEQAGFSLGPPPLADDTPKGQAVAAEPAAPSTPEPAWDAERWSPPDAVESDDWAEDETGWDSDADAPVMLGTDEPVAPPRFVLAELQAWEATFRSATRAAEPEPEREPAALAPETEHVEAAPEPEAEPALGAEPEAAAEPAFGAEPEVEAAPEPEAAAEPALGAEPEVEAAPEPEAEPALGAEPEVEAAPEPEAEPALGAEPEVEAAPEPEAEPALGAEPEVDVAAEDEAIARARALAAAWIPRSAPPPARPVSSVFGGPAPWSATEDMAREPAVAEEQPADREPAEGAEWTMDLGTDAHPEEAVPADSAHEAPLEPEPAREAAEPAEPVEAAEPAEPAEDELEDDLASVEDRWWVEPAPAAEDEETASAMAPEGAAEAASPDAAADSTSDEAAERTAAEAETETDVDADRLPGSPDAAADEGAAASWTNAWSLPSEAPTEEVIESWPPAAQLSVPAEPTTGADVPMATRQRTPGLMERHLEPTGVRSFSVLSASPESVASRQPVPLAAEAAESPSAEPTTIDLGVSVRNHAEAPDSQGPMGAPLTPEAQLRAQFRQRAAAAAGGTGGAPAPNALWLLTGEPERGATAADDDVSSSRIVNVVLTIFAIVVVVVLVIGFLWIASDVFRAP